MSTPVLYTSSLFATGTLSTSGINNTRGDIVNTTGNILVRGANAQIVVGPGGFSPSAIITSNFIQTPNLITSLFDADNVRTNNISTNNISTFRITANRGIYSTLSTTNMNAIFISSINHYTDFINVSRIARIENLGVEGAAFFSGNLTGTEPDKYLLWNGPVEATSTITTPIMYISSTSGNASIDNNNNTPYGLGINSDAFEVRSVTSSNYVPIITSTSNIVTQNLTEQTRFTSPAISTNTISTNNLYAGQTYVTTGNYSTLNSQMANLSTANISTVNIGRFTASEIDANTISSLSSRVQFALASTLQFTANTTVSPNINLGLGDVIQGLIGGAATQALGVTVGTAGLATGATALITARTSGGASPGTFQVVNGQTQLQFSTLGTLTPSIYQTTNSLDPTRTPGTLVNLTSNISSGTYCVRSISDPLNIDSATEAIQSFGQWVPVVQPNVTIPSITISSLTTSSIVSRSATISSLTVSSINSAATVAPSTLFASTINYVGALTGTNIAAPLTWPGPATIPSTAINELRFINSVGAQTGRMLGTSEFLKGINMIAPNGFVVQNNTNAIARFNPDRTTSIFSTLLVQDVVCYENMYVSTLNASTVNADITVVIPSTLQTSTINMTGDLNNANSNAYLTWAGEAQFKTGVESQGYLIINPTLAPVGIIRPGLDNNVIFDYNALTFRGGGGAFNRSTLTLASNGTATFLSTLTSADRLRFGPAAIGNPYISTSIGSGEQEAIFYGGSTMTLQADETMRLQVGPFNPFVFNNYDSPSPGCAVNLNASPMTFTGDPSIGVFNFATFNIPARFNQSTIMRGPYNGVSTMAISTFTNNNFASQTAVISSLTVSSINTPGNVPVGIPVGGIMPWAGGNAFAPNIPVGWLLCDGSQYSQTTYAALYEVIGTTYERFSPNIGNFFVPDLRFTFPMCPPSYGPGPPTALVNPPSGTAFSQPTNLGYPGVAANQIWTFTALKNGVLVPGMTFAGRGPNGAAAFIDRMIDGNGDIGSYIMTSFSVGTWPALGSVGAPVLVSPINIGTGANYPYKIGTYNDSGYNANPNSNTQIYEWGRNINGSNVGVRGATANTFGGIMNTYSTPVSVGGLSFQTSPNFINMFYIIKY